MKKLMHRSKELTYSITSSTMTTRVCGKGQTLYFCDSEWCPLSPDRQPNTGSRVASLDSLIGFRQLSKYVSSSQAPDDELLGLWNQPQLRRE